MAPLPSVQPRTGTRSETTIEPTTLAELDAAVASARSAFRELGRLGRAWRADLLRAMAAELEARSAEITETADAETGLGLPRLTGELTRTCYQLRFFAGVVDEGGYLEAAVDHAGDTPMGPRPDLRRMLVPLGPVAVFGASNFPLAFSVPGGDTAAALAAGCPVIVKAHELHPLTSRLCGEALAAAATAAGAPRGAVSVCFGREIGAPLVTHPGITAVGFTGSATGGRALLDLVNRRPDPIPFYGELAGVNPLVVTPAAAGERAEDIGNGLAASFTLGAGQFCTKPGLAFVPRTPSGDALVAALGRAAGNTASQVLLGEGILAAFTADADRLASLPSVTTIAKGGEAGTAGFLATPRVLGVEAGDLAESADILARECFGPLVVVVRYRDHAELLTALGGIEPSLTATVHLGDGEAESGEADELLEGLLALSGRLVFDGYPTGVAVSWAQHHGGPWPSTSSIHTSVGATAIRRFLRPRAWQSAPEAVLPPELREGGTGIPRRVDGVLTLPGED